MPIPRPRSIFDCHCHIASTDFIPRSFLEGSVSNVLAKLEAEGVRTTRNKILDIYLSQMQDHDCSDLLGQMEKSGIGRAVLLLPDFTYALPDCKLTIAEMFDRHRQVLEAHPDNFLVFAGVDPRWGAEGLRLFEKGVTDYAFSGMKLYPPCGYRASDRPLYPYYEICVARSLPVLVHTGGTSPALSFDLAHPRYIDGPARDFPKLCFILAHGSTAFVDDCVMMCAFRPNVFLDVSAYHSKPIERLREIFDKGINHKILFGTDWPVFRMQGSQQSSMEILLDDNGPLRTLRPREMEAFFGGSLERILARANRAAPAAAGSSGPGL